MDAAAALKQYDAMFGVEPIEKIEQFLDEQLALARSGNDRGALFALLNESVGLARSLRKREKALAGCEELLDLADTLGVSCSPQYATMLLNVGTAYSVFGRYECAESLFRKAEALFLSFGVGHAYELASLYNNWSLLYAQQRRFAESVSLQKKALSGIDALDGAAEEKATSRANIASILARQFEAERANALLDEAEQLINEAIALFRAEACDSFHYGTALIAQGDIRMARGDPSAAAEAYASAMAQLERTIGQGAQYEAARTLYERARLAEEAL
ncbi:MAG: tetratricopeptide repeat protein [Ruminococcaceae bacterium]|jgi:tetratricopeptide (TPR) repeat protein|nr:tetratricopeptide repeat protein [Oscillospiraceae bacterium]